MRVLAACMPFVMLGGIVLTANHYFLDAAAGALVSIMGLGLAVMLRRGLPRNAVSNFLA